MYICGFFPFNTVKLQFYLEILVSFQSERKQKGKCGNNGGQNNIFTAVNCSNSIATVPKNRVK